MTSTALSLRPLGTGELLDRAVRLYRRHFLTFLGIVAIVQIPLALVSLVFTLVLRGGTYSAAETSQAATLVGVIGLGVVSILSFILIQALGTAALTSATADSYLGQPVSLGGAYRKIGRTWLVLVVALLLIMLISLGITLWWIFVPCIGWLTGLGMLFFVGLVISPLVAPVVVLEKKRGRSAVRRAWDLARRRFWPVVGFVTALFILSSIFSTLPSTVVSFLTQMGIVSSPDPLGNQAVISTVISSLTTLLFSLLFLPFQLTAMTLLYFDLRIRTEGFDLAMLAQSAGMESSSGLASNAESETIEAEQQASELALADEPGVETDVAEATAEAPPAETRGIITRNELLYFLVLTLAAGAIYLVFVTLIGGLGILAAGLAGG